MPRYLVTTKRSERGSAMSAIDAVKGQPGITLLSSADDQSVTIETTEETADRLRTRLAGTHFVEPEIRRSLQ